MIKEHRLFWARLLFLGDLFIILASWIIAYYFRFYTGIIPVTKGIYSFSYHMSLAIVILTIWGIVLQFSGLYKFKRLISRARAIDKIFKATLVATLIFIALTYLFKEYRFSRGVIFYFLGTSLVLLFLFRLFFREALFYLRKKGHNLRHILIIGEGPLAQTTLKKIEDHREIGLKIIGFISPHLEKVGQKINNYKIIGRIEELPSLIKDLQPDQLIIALDAKNYSYLNPLLQILKNETIDIKIVPEFYRFGSFSYDLEDLDGLPFITLNDTPLDSWNFFLKRLFDVVLSLIFLITTLPLSLFISILIKILSPGPIFYSQERIGLDGKKFKIYKFRTMRINAEKETGAVWATADDPRRTWLGTVLRKTSIDEIPQFINIIKGDMSLVGPRPERPVFVDQFKENFPSYMLRHKVKSGLTGWAQVNGWRGNTDLKIRIEHDLFYIKHWSFLLDFKIIWLTLWRGIFSKNAY